MLVRCVTVRAFFVVVCVGWELKGICAYTLVANGSGPCDCVVGCQIQAYDIAWYCWLVVGLVRFRGSRAKMGKMLTLSVGRVGERAGQRPREGETLGVRRFEDDLYIFNPVF